jgi:ornithine cyclodeaminase/alanine dehydrogenase
VTLFLSSSDVAELASPKDAVEAMREGFLAEAADRTSLPPRLDADSPSGFLRVMPAILDDVMGCKIMTLVRGAGTRYVVMLFSVDDGACLAVIDADVLTKVRTAATTALAARHLRAEPPRVLGVLGTGYEARGHVAVLAEVWPLEEICVHSRSEANRRAFAEEVEAVNGVRVRAAAGRDEAAASSDVVLLATKSTTPVVDGTAFGPGTVVLSIGSTRPDLRELDITSLARADRLLVDSAQQVATESGDIVAGLAEGALTDDRMVALATLVADDRVLDRPAGGERDLLVFKSVGTSIQDLALARHLLRLAGTEGRGRDIGEVGRLKAFT